MSPVSSITSASHVPPAAAPHLSHTCRGRDVRNRRAVLPSAKGEVDTEAQQQQQQTHLQHRDNSVVRTSLYFIDTL
ncbi:hypothetical protein E2C01_019438 [Portunus trituberculatus]|uniref:Uncharacterized protein n=1 Tax=Portunus trituberculatus TaxID=210409 RepID=A0A5B7DX71_PORTR|nr:hypothetical protein [Portunus trituberculatus]